MACSFTIPFNGSPDALVANIQRKILSGNGVFGGDENTGTFSIQAMGAAIEGSYGISGTEISINIHKKPFFVGCSMIESYVRENLTT